MKAALTFCILFASIFVVPAQSISESTDYVISGSGYGILRNSVHDVTIELLLKGDGNTVVFQNGQILIDSQVRSIRDLSLTLLQNGKAIEISGVTNDSIDISAKGRLAASNGGGSIYQLIGQTNDKNNSQKLILSVVLAPERTASQTSSGDKQDVLLLVDHYARVEWKSPYKFIVKTFDPKLNPTSNFNTVYGSIDGVKIHAKITDPLGNTFKISEGVTQKFGYYEDIILIPDNARTGNYVLNVTASGDKFNTVTKELTFLVIPFVPPSATTS